MNHRQSFVLLQGFSKLIHQLTYFKDNILMEQTEVQAQAQTMSIGEWFVTLLISGIPLIGLIMLFVWGFGSNPNTVKANWAKATLIWYGIAIILFFMFGLSMIAMLSHIVHPSSQV